MVQKKSRTSGARAVHVAKKTRIVRVRKSLATDSVKDLEQRLGYPFRDRAHLEKALTHSSYRFETPGTPHDNQRLEFLGDAALAFAVAAWLFEKYPEFQEGPLTVARSRCIRTASLARVARALNLGAGMKLGRGESLMGGAARDSTLEDALEAVMGAVYLDGGWPAMMEVFNRVFKPLLEDIVSAGGELNPKGQLQEVCQARWKKSPVYRLVSEIGPAHQKQFEVEVSLDGRELGRGAGSNRRMAETEAARVALQGLS